MKLLNPTDSELDAAFAEKVCGMDVVTPRSWISGDCVTRVTAPAFIPSFCSSADAVLPWLEKWHWGGHSNGMSGSTHGYPHYSIWIQIPGGERIEAHVFHGDSVATALPRAAVIALLRAHGVEVEFKKTA